MSEPFYCLFYSFKGGVGRTSALMNTARYLARRKKRVLVIDLDLAAPGVDIFDLWQPQKNEESDANIPGFPSYHPTKYRWAHERNFQTGGGWEWVNGIAKPVPYDVIKNHVEGAPKGFVEFALKYQDYLDKAQQDSPPELAYPEDFRAGESIQEWDRERYLYRLPPRGPEEADILIMRAGNYDKEGYDKLRSKLRFADLGDPGDNPQQPNQDNHFVRPGKSSFADHLHEQVKEKIAPDYVLIDGRPGMDDASLFAMRHFADCAVLCFNLNPWNFRGAIQAYNKINEFYREDKGAKKGDPDIWHPHILLLASPIPPQAQNSTLYSGQFETVKEKMGNAVNSGKRESGGPVEIAYSEALLLRDVLISDLSETDPICLRYQTLTDLLIQCNVSDPNNLTRNALSAGNHQAISEAFDNLLRKEKASVPILHAYGQYLLQTGHEEKAKSHLLQAWNQVDASDQGTKQRSPYQQDTALQLGRTELALVRNELIRLRESRLDKEAREKECKPLCDTLNEVAKRCDRFRKPDDPATAPFQMQHAQASVLLADVTSLMWGSDSPDAKQKLRDAYADYQALTRLTPHDPQVLHDQAHVEWRLALFEQQGMEAYENAIAHYAALVNMRSDYPEALLDWGRHLVSLAVISSDRPMPLMRDRAPFVEWQAELPDWPTAGSPVQIESAKGWERLEQAEKHLHKCLQQRSDLFLAHAYRGLLALVKALMYQPGDAERLECFKQAADYFARTTVYQPRFSSAFLYGGLSQLLLWQEEQVGQAIKRVRFRQAFYRLEHFIDQELDNILEYGTDQRIMCKFESFQSAYQNARQAVQGKLRDPFYFDPDDIALIEQNPFAFVHFLEKYTFLLPLTPALHKSTQLNTKDVEQFLKSIVAHLRVVGD